jgi:hypothetical protein
MKKISLILVLLAFVFVSSAQIVGSFDAFVADTTTNAETEYLILDSPKAIKGNYAVSIAVFPVNASGTATVTAQVEVSIDNTTFIPLGSAVTVNNAGTAVNYGYEYVNAYWRYYRVKLVSTGTGVTNFTGSIGLKRL